MTGSIAPIRRQIVVPINPLSSFEIFTRDIGLWWPMERHSVDGAGGSVAFGDGRLIETSATGETSIWGEVLEWKPGELLRLSWFPGHTPAEATDLRIQFASVESAGGGGATLVTLEHDGWERTIDAEGARQEYEAGWPTVVSRFGEATVVTSADDEQTWLVLRHTAGPSAPEQGPLFAHPDFAEHAAFLESLAEAGVLVAAGPLAIGDQPGAFGMTVIKVPSSESEQYLRLARSGDQSVVRGLLDVDPVAWNVVMSG